MGSRSQYEVLGIDAKRDMPIRDDRDVWLLAFLMPFTGNLDRPIRDGSLIKTLTQSGSWRILGYFHLVPAGTSRLSLGKKLSSAKEAAHARGSWRDWSKAVSFSF